MITEADQLVIQITAIIVGGLENSLGSPLFEDIAERDTENPMEYQAFCRGFDASLFILKAAMEDLKSGKHERN